MILPPGSRTMSGNITATNSTSTTNSNNNNNNSTHQTQNCVNEPSNRMILPTQSRNDQLNPYSRHTVNYDVMKSEYERLMTFFTVPPWPVSFIQPADCARAGFFFVQEGDKVQCAFCRGVAGEWEPNDHPMTEHRRHFPRCPFVCNLPVGNIPMSHDDDEEPQTTPAPEEPFDLGVDVCGPFDAASLHPEMESPRIKGCRPLRASIEEFSNQYALKECRGPSNSQMVTSQARLKTFTDMKWPSTTGQNPEVLVEAGLYYTGSQDMCKCFYCDGGLRNWEAGDDPWVEHARWFPKCTYVILNKGDEFIKQVTEELSKQGSAEESSEAASASSSSSSQSSSNSSQSSGVLPSSARCSTSSSSSSDEEEIEPSLERNFGIEIASVSGNSTSGVETSSSNSDRSSRNSIRECTSTSGNSSGEEEDESVSVKKNKKLSEEKEQDLVEELRKLREARQCKICMDDEISVVFLPCCHLVSCTKCATAFTHCALCRHPVKALVKTYMS